MRFAGRRRKSCRLKGDTVNYFRLQFRIYLIADSLSGVYGPDSREVVL
jgi:hypothetical protein